MINDRDERWLPVDGYEDLYEVSNHGRVRSLERSVKGRILGAQPSGRYVCVSLSKDGTLQTRRIHRLVAEAFLGIPADGNLEVCHNDNDGTNNHLSNLRWDTRAGNFADKRRHGTDHNGSKTHCKWGHEYSPDNTAVYVRPGHIERDCLQCRKERWQRIKRARLARG